jgi:hypothetical protein
MVSADLIITVFENQNAPEQARFGSILVVKSVIWVRVIKPA